MGLQGRTGIVYLIDFLANREGVTGGTERQLVELAKRLDPERFRPVVFCLQEFCRTPFWEGLSCEKHVLDVYSLGSRRGAEAFLWFVRYLRQNRVDIVQTYFHDSTLFGIAAARLAGVKRTVSCRRDLGFWHEGGTKTRLSLVNRITHRILVNSRAVKDAVVKLEGVAPDKVDVILNGIDADAVELTAPAPLRREFPAIGPGDRVVGMVANLNRGVKRVDVLVRAAFEVRKRVPGARFLVVGGGRLEGGLRRLIRELGLEGAVILAGARDSALAYVKAFDVGVLTSDSEGFPNAILEYMAAGVPVVATDVGGNREVVRDRSLGVLVPPGDHAALARAIVGLLEDDARRAETGSRGRGLIRSTFAWDRKIGEMSRYYEGLLSRP